MGGEEDTLYSVPDPHAVYVNSCKNLPKGKTVILVGSQRVEAASELFYSSVSVSDKCTLRGMLDSGSMSCTLSDHAETKLRDLGVVFEPQPVPGNVVLIGCGGLSTQPKCIYDLNIEIYGSRFVVPTLVVPGQRDELIVGSNVLRPLIQRMKSDPRYWELVSSSNSDPDCEQFLQLLSCISRWSGPELSDRIGIVKLQQSVTLLPQQEYVVWGQLPPSAPVSPGSTVIVEPSASRSTPKNILVGRVVTPMWGDHWVPMKILYPTHSPVTLRRNAKIADVFPCVALEELSITQGLCEAKTGCSAESSPSANKAPDPVLQLGQCGLADIDIKGF